MHLLAHGDKSANQNITLLDDFEEHHHKLHANDDNTTAKRVTLTWRDCSAQLSYMSSEVCAFVCSTRLACAVPTDSALPRDSARVLHRDYTMMDYG